MTMRRTLLRRRCVGFVFQAFHVLPYLTVEQTSPCRSSCCGVDETRARAAHRARCWTPVGISALARRYPRELSGRRNAARRDCARAGAPAAPGARR